MEVKCWIHGGLGGMHDCINPYALLYSESVLCLFSVQANLLIKPCKILHPRWHAINKDNVF